MGHRHLGGLPLILALLLMLPLGAQAAVVGQFTQVEGRVDLLKGGNLPANPVKVEDGVEPGDVIRTKSLSRAQLKFVDDTVLNIAPESRVGIEEYMYDAAKGERQAVLQVFRGLVHTLVGKVMKLEKPDFIMKTHTGILGIRGTQWYTSLGPQFTDVYTEKGCISAKNFYKEVTGEVKICKMEFSRIALDLPPTVPTPIVPEDLQMLKQRMTSGGSARGGAGTPAGTQPGSGAFATAGVGKIQQTLMTNLASGLYVTPNPVPASTPSTTTSFSFSQSFTGTYLLTSLYPNTVGTYTSASPGSGVRTGAYPGTFTSSFAIIATSPIPLFSSGVTGGFTSTSSGTVIGRPGGVLTGTMTMTAATTGGTTFNLSGPVTLGPGGNLAFNTTGTFNLGGTTGTTTGALVQNNTTTGALVQNKK